MGNEKLFETDEFLNDENDNSDDKIQYIDLASLILDNN